jgi:hypothetical protein
MTQSECLAGMCDAETAPLSIVVARRSVIRALFACMALLILAGLAGQVSTWFLGRGTLLGFVRQFDVGQENNVPTWFSTMCLFLCALALSVIALSEWRRRMPLSRYWIALSGTFAILSLDEAASFHEMLVPPVRSLLHTGGFFYFAWVIPGGLFVIGFALLFSDFLRRLPSETRCSFLVAGAVYVSGSLGMEMIDGNYLSVHQRPDFTYSMMVIVEESLEMIGAILFLRALLRHLEKDVGTFSVRLTGRAAS